MRIKKGFILREVADSWIVVPIGERVVEFNGLMTLSESGALLWRNLEKGSDINELVSSILEEYDIDEATTRADVQEFISAIQEKGLLE
ncbi:hypothetical protein CPJCM30710_13950 [Clostridium polyendosporum]|uniref:Coenzyme PQQ synthesis protein D (PqqD) n=1 Tax=Clostridium polyendosporum TaxID=69208 RepID=A0A919RZM4_9CLOT|nr:PqqD family protein [Clostridium polyendosporum]GIM28729.1 hypothetical protein CPJCM30710_13950 [Clostridium polyendosporum]